MNTKQFKAFLKYCLTDLIIERRLKSGKFNLRYNCQLQFTLSCLSRDYVSCAIKHLIVISNTIFLVPKIFLMNTIKCITKRIKCSNYQKFVIQIHLDKICISYRLTQSRTLLFNIYHQPISLHIIHIWTVTIYCLVSSYSKYHVNLYVCCWLYQQQ